MKDIIKWSIFNAAFVAVIVAGLGFGIVGAANVALTVGWTIAIISLLAFIPAVSEAVIEGIVKKYKEGTDYGTPIWINNIVDVAIGLVFIWFGYVILGALYAIGNYMLSTLKDKALEEIQKDKADENDSEG